MVDGSRGSCSEVGRGARHRARARAIFGSLALAASSAAAAHAAPCGTVAVPTACTITMGDVVTYTFSNFAVVSSGATGGGTVYTGADIDIDLGVGGTFLAILSFSKNDAPPAPVFVANLGQTSTFTVTYDVTVSAAAPGSVSFASPFLLDTEGASSAGDGSGRVELVIPGAPTCATDIPGGGQASCTVPPQPLTINLSDVVSLSGNRGNVSFNGFSNAVDGTFAAAPPTPPTLSQAFAPDTIPAGNVATLTVTLGNPNGTVATLTAPLVETLPAALVVAGTPNVASSCFGGPPTAVAGGSTVTLPSGRSIPIDQSCTFSVDVTSNVAGTHVATLPPAALVTSNGSNASAASAALVVLGPIAAVPTVSEWGLALLGALLAFLGAAALRRSGSARVSALSRRPPADPS